MIEFEDFSNKVLPSSESLPKYFERSTRFVNTLIPFRFRHKEYSVSVSFDIDQLINDVELDSMSVVIIP